MAGVFLLTIFDCNKYITNMKLIAKTRFLNAMSGEILDPKDEFEVKTQADVDYFVLHGLADEVKEKEEKTKHDTKEEKTKIKTK